MFDNAGLKIVQAEFVTLAPEQTEFVEHWNRAPAELRRALSANPFGLVYQVVVKAVPTTADVEAVSLMSMAGERAWGKKSSFIAKAKALVRPYISDGIRIRLLGVMRRMGIHI
ncbi:MAG: hypothetical protein AYP45_08435 [Candidatus Brocadia carolinensis]|uniref:Uncharacterized protein n=1 Tax=Candidatus Brocadia carolinensis TaxID=1004156 RepID=A0A1V4AU08_9BACT|nr:MAG: hypothetical protein AYP45_08435 [Candidatus Brocadia caroliniensis]